MNLGPVSYLDCAVFCLFLAPQLIWRAGLFETAWCALQALPFLCECSAVPGTTDHVVVPTRPDRLGL
jgi:hypothetical protein